LRWNVPQEVARVEVDVDGRDDSWPQTITWEGALETGKRRPLPAEVLRPVRPRRQRNGSPHGQVYVLTAPVPLKELCLVRAEGNAWGIAEVRVFCGR
jgi:hypothetical protein